MKSTYTDNFMHKIVFVPPVYHRKGKPVQAPAVVLAVKGSREDAIKYAIDATDRFAKRPGLIKVIPASEQVPHVGRNSHGRVLSEKAA